MIIIWQGWIMILTCSANTSNQCKALTPWHRLVAGLITNLLIVYDSMIDPNFKAYYCSDLPWIFTRGDNAGVSQGEVLLLGSCWQQLTCLPPLVPKQSLEKIWRKGFNSGWLLGVLIISSGTCPQWRLGITKFVCSHHRSHLNCQQFLHNGKRWIPAYLLLQNLSVYASTPLMYPSNAVFGYDSYSVLIDTWCNVCIC